MKGSWWVDLRFNHLRYRKRSPENSRAGALAFEAVLRHKLACGEDIERLPPATLRQPSFEQFASTWFNEYVLPNNKYSEQRSKKYILSAALVPFFGKLPVDQISAHHIERYKASRISAGTSNKTVNNHLTVLNTCLGAAYEWLSVTGTPPKIKWLKCPPPDTGHLSAEECATLLAHADGVVYELILTALRTGMRQGELKGLQWTSIDWDNHIITVRHSRCDYRKALTTTKSNRERHIPFDREIQQLLARRKQNAGYVFLDTDGKPFDRARLTHRIERACKDAGIRRVTWHVLRHTFATHLSMRGAPLNTVQALLGHSSITTTMRYAHVAPSTLRTSIELLSRDGANRGQPVGNHLRMGN